MNDLKNPLVVASGILALGIVIGAGWIGSVQKEIRTMDRTVSARGLVEREVLADTGMWQLSTSAAGDDLALTQTQLEKNIDAIKRFLMEKGFKEEELSLSPIRVLDRKAAQYDQQKEGQTRYIIQNSVNLRSNNIELIQKVARMTNELVRAGITLSQQETGCNGPSFLFTKLNEIKPEMLIEATKNARKAAEQFANDSGSDVGKIKRAWQGSFSITERDQATGDTESGYNPCNADPNKKVRVVTTVDYYLE